jgi:hypothetical protein
LNINIKVQSQDLVTIIHVHRILKEKHNYTIITWKGLHQYPMDDLAAHGVPRNRLCQRKIHPKKLLDFEALFSLKLATNPIDFYSLLWHTLKGEIKGLFIEYKSNPSPIRGLIELLVQVGEGKLFPFLNLPCYQDLSLDYARSHLELCSSSGVRSSI